MQSRLIEQFKGLPNLDAWVKAAGAQFTDIEEALGQLLAGLAFQNAVGAQLDEIGVALHQGRGELDDDTYKTVLQSRIVQYQGNGTIEDIIQILITLGGCSAVTITEFFPARFQADLEGLNPLVSNADLYSAVLQSKLAGVRADVFIPAPTNPQFTFDHVIDATHAGFDQGHLRGPII